MDNLNAEDRVQCRRLLLVKVRDLPPVPSEAIRQELIAVASHFVDAWEAYERRYLELQDDLRHAQQDERNAEIRYRALANEQLADRAKMQKLESDLAERRNAVRLLAKRTTRQAQTIDRQRKELKQLRKPVPISAGLPSWRDRARVTSFDLLD